jgi:VanZ family protein
MARAGSPRLLAAALAYAAVIFAISQIPGKELARLGVDLWDKSAHALVYLPLGALIMAWIRARRPPSVPRALGRDLLTAAIAVLAYGALDELHQAFVPGRTPSWGDAVADLVGGTVGAAGVAVFARKLAGRGPEPLEELEPREEDHPVELVAGDPRRLDDGRDRE